MERLIRDTGAAIELNALFQKLSIERGGDEEMDAQVARLFAEAEKIANPKAFYRQAHVDEVREDYAVVDGVRFSSPLVSRNLGAEENGMIYPYTATCGRELYIWAKSLTDFYEQYIADCIMELYLRRIMETLHGTVKHAHFEGRDMSAMAPGSLETWPVSEQVPLFEVLGKGAADAGVEVSESLLLYPIKSVSGFYFTSAQHFENCAMCPRLDCPNRRAPFDEALSMLAMGGGCGV